jgi:hypothetical protein
MVPTLESPEKSREDFMLPLRILLLSSLMLAAWATSPANADVKGGPYMKAAPGPQMGGPQPDPPGLKKTLLGPFLGGPQPDPPGVSAVRKTPTPK